MNNTTLTTLVQTKIDEITSKIVFLESDACTSAETTKKTQGYQLRRARKVLHLIEDLATNGVEKLNKSSLETLTTLTTLEDERERSHVVVQEGDLIEELLTVKYRDVKDIFNKITKAAEKVGCVLDFATGKIVKAAK